MESFLERGDDGKPIGMSKFFNKYLPDITGKELADDINRLWHQLSRDWLHLRGYVRKVVDRTIETGPPSWAICAPMTYNETDKKDLGELSERIEETRRIFIKIKELRLHGPVIP